MSVPKQHIRHFNVLEKLGKPIGQGGLICLAEQALPLTAATWSIPVGELG